MGPIAGATSSRDGCCTRGRTAILAPELAFVVLCPGRQLMTLRPTLRWSRESSACEARCSNGRGAQVILEAEGRSRVENSGAALWEQTSEAERVLAENWTQDYAEGAVEWLLVGSAGCINQGCSEPPG